MIRRALVALALAAAVRVSPLSAAVAHSGQPVMGTVLEATVIAADQATAQRLADDAIAIARHWDDVLTTWRPEGELARLNARAGSGPVPVSSDLAASFQRMQEMYAATGGAFDPAVGPLVRLWSAPAPPAPEALGAVGPHRLPEAAHATSSTIDLARGAALDSGAIGKSIALDAIAAHLRAGGVQAAFLNFGGSSQLAIGAPPDTPNGWNIVVAGLQRGEILGRLSLRDASLSTSRALGAGAEAGPIVDPRAGTPVQPPRIATVLAPDATTANAWSTALVVLGRNGIDHLAQHQLQAVVADSSGTTQTPHFPLLPRSP